MFVVIFLAIFAGILIYIAASEPIAEDDGL